MECSFQHPSPALKGLYLCFLCQHLPAYVSFTYLHAERGGRGEGGGEGGGERDDLQSQQYNLKIMLTRSCCICPWSKKDFCDFCVFGNNFKTHPISKNAFATVLTNAHKYMQTNIWITCMLWKKCFFL